MKFKLALLAVQDVERSKKFYHDFFDQIVVLDLGWNVTFSGGFAIQQNFFMAHQCSTGIGYSKIPQHGTVFRS